MNKNKIKEELLKDERIKEVIFNNEDIVLKINLDKSITSRTGKQMRSLLKKVATDRTINKKTNVVIKGKNFKQVIEHALEIDGMWYKIGHNNWFCGALYTITFEKIPSECIMLITTDIKNAMNVLKEAK